MQNFDLIAEPTGMAPANTYGFHMIPIIDSEDPQRWTYYVAGELSCFGLGDWSPIPLCHDSSSGNYMENFPACQFPRISYNFHLVIRILAYKAPASQ